MQEASSRSATTKSWENKLKNATKMFILIYAHRYVYVQIHMHMHNIQTHRYANSAREASWNLNYLLSIWPLPPLAASFGQSERDKCICQQSSASSSTLSTTTAHLTHNTFRVQRPIFAPNYGRLVAPSAYSFAHCENKRNDSRSVTRTPPFPYTMSAAVVVGPLQDTRPWPIHMLWCGLPLALQPSCRYT